MSSSIIRRCDCPELLLPCSVPDLQLENLLLDLDCLDFLLGPYEIYTDCGYETLGVGVVGETEQHAGFAHTGITD